MNSADNSNHLKVNDSLKAYLLIIAKWTRFLSTLGFVTAGLLFLLLIVAIRGSVEIGYGISALQGFGWLISIIVSTTIATHLANFTRGVKSSIITDDSEELSVAFGFLKSYFQIVGAFSVIGVALPVVLVVLFILDVLFD